jgi:autotransporter-associated beta strand protein
MNYIRIRKLLCTCACFCLLVSFLASDLRAGIFYWDPNGLSTPGSGTWDTTNLQWATSSTLTASPVAWNTANLAVFIAGGTSLSSATIAVNSPITTAGVFNSGIGSAGGVTNLTFVGSGSLSFTGGQGFSTASGKNTFFTIPLTDVAAQPPGQLVAEGAGQLYLFATNTYSGGTELGFPPSTYNIVNFTNTFAFGSGPIIVAINGGALVLNEPGYAVTITNAVTCTNSINLVGNTNALTFSGSWDVSSFTPSIGSGGSAGFIVNISGPIGGTGGIIKGLNNTGTLILSGANTYSGKTSVTNGILRISSLNNVTGGTPASNLGHPTTVANGTITLGSGTNSGTLQYTGAGETTDRIIDLGGMTGGGTVQNDGTGAIIFTSDLTISGSGAKTLTLRGTNTGNNTILGRIADSGGNTSVTKSDAGFWTLAGVNTYSGNTTLNTAGRLNLANSSALGNGTLVIGGNGSFDNTSGADLTIANGITCSGGSPTYVGSTNNMTVNGPALITGNNRTITVTTNTLTLGSTLGDSGQNRNFTKSGAGTLVLLGGGSYGGNTTVSSGGGALIIGGSGQLGSGGAFAGTIANSSKFNYASSAAQTLSGVISGSGTIIQSGSGTLTLTATNTYTGATTISAGTLALSGGGSLANGSSVSIAAGATFDVSARTSATYTLGTNATLTATGTGPTPGVNAATIVGASGGTVSLGSRPISLTFTPTAFTGDSTHPSLFISQGTLALNGNAFTVNNASGTPLGIGTYRIIQQATGNITTSGAYSATVTGSGVTAGNAGYISVTGGNANLIVAPAVSFSDLTPSQAISASTAGITLSGTVSGAGPIYPANGEPITVVINGNSQSTTVNDATGDFSINYNSSAIPGSATPYTITYYYPGNGTTLSGAVNTSTTLTVTNPPSHTNFVSSIVNNGNGSFTLNFIGTPQALYYLVSATNITQPMSSWTLVPGSTNAASGAGAWSFNVTNPSPAYYRSAAVNPGP